MGKDMAIRQIAIQATEIAFRWPIEGEIWSVRYENGVPVLDSIAETVDANDLNIEALNPGDVMIAGKVITDSVGREFVTVDGEPINGQFLMWDSDNQVWRPGTPEAELSDKTYIHTQSSPATTWTITHGLNKYPSVTVIDSAGDHVGGVEFNYDSFSQVTLHFGAAFAGKAILN